MTLRHTTRVNAVVVGAGQAGLAAAYHLRRRGYIAVDTAKVVGNPTQQPTFVVLDAEQGSGGAWRHRWPSLTMKTVNRVYELPGHPLDGFEETAQVNELLPAYFGEYEREMELHIQRPVQVTAVREFEPDTGAATGATGAPAGPLLVETDSGSNYLTDAVIGATGTWGKPFWPQYPGIETFQGRQLHTHEFRAAADFTGKRVVVVGGGISAVQHLLEIAPVASTLWVTRREPEWVSGPFDDERGRAAVALVEERAKQGLPPQSVVSVTGLPLDGHYQEGIDSGILHRFPMFTSVTEREVVWEPDGILKEDIPALANRRARGVGEASPGWSWHADVILWATGFRAALDYLAPMKLREHGGGIVMEGTTVVRDPRFQLVGYGPSSSTIGANRAGRTAARGAEYALRQARSAE